MVDLDFAHDVAWEFVYEVNISGDGVVGKVLRDVLSDLLWGERVGFVCDDVGGDSLEGVFVFDSDACCFGDFGH